MQSHEINNSQGTFNGAIKLQPFACKEYQAASPAILGTDWLTANEAALYLKVKPRTVLLWARQGNLKGFPLSGAKRHVWRFRRCDLDAMLMPPSGALYAKGER